MFGWLQFVSSGAESMISDWSKKMKVIQCIRSLLQAEGNSIIRIIHGETGRDSGPQTAQLSVDARWSSTLLDISHDNDTLDTTDWRGQTSDTLGRTECSSQTPLVGRDRIECQGIPSDMWVFEFLRLLWVSDFPLSKIASRSYAPIFNHGNMGVWFLFSARLLTP